MDSNHNKQYQKLSYYRYTKWDKNNLAPSLGRVPLEVLLPTIHARIGILSLVGGILLRIKFRKVEDGCVDIYFYDWHCFGII